MFKFLKADPDKIVEIAEKGIDNVSSGIDKMFYTDEEKADALAKKLEIADKFAQTHIKLMEATASENSIKSITRRIVALMIFAFTFLSLPAIIILYKINHTAAKFAVDLYVAFYIPHIVLAATIFFFGNHMLGTFQAGKK